jgi:lauroyl/myristoyl acyltransferase
MNIELEEIISFLARRGEADIVQLLRHIQEEYERSFDPDYESESDTDSEVSMNDIVEEAIEINPSMNGFISLA